MQSPYFLRRGEGNKVVALEDTFYGLTLDFFYDSPDQFGFCEGRYHFWLKT